MKLSQRFKRRIRTLRRMRTIKTRYPIFRKPRS